MSTKNVKSAMDIAKGLNPKALSQDFNEPKKKAGPEADAMNELFGLIALECPFFLRLSDDDLTRKKNMWIGGLAKYDRKTRMTALGNAVKGVMSKGGPSLGEFIKLCSNQHRPELAGKPKLLPAPEPSATVREEHLAKMKDLLGIQTTTNTK